MLTRDLFAVGNLVTLRDSCDAVYCNRSCLFMCGWVCYHDKSKLPASILTKLGLQVKVVTISSWLNIFGRPAPQGRGLRQGNFFLALPYYSQRAVFASPLHWSCCCASLSLDAAYHQCRLVDVQQNWYAVMLHVSRDLLATNHVTVFLVRHKTTHYY